MSVKYYVKAAVSEYVDKDGKSKKKYQSIGVVLETKNGDLMIKIESLPLFALKDGSLMAYLNVPEPKDPFPKALEDVPF